MASQGGHTTTVDVLLRQGAHPNIADNVRNTIKCTNHVNALTVIPQIRAVMTTYHGRMCTTDVHAV